MKNNFSSEKFVSVFLKIINHYRIEEYMKIYIDS